MTEIEGIVIERETGIGTEIEIEIEIVIEIVIENGHIVRVHHHHHEKEDERKRHLQGGTKPHRSHFQVSAFPTLQQQ